MHDIFYRIIWLHYYYFEMDQNSEINIYKYQIQHMLVEIPIPISACTIVVAVKRRFLNKIANYVYFALTSYMKVFTTVNFLML